MAATPPKSSATMQLKQIVVTNVLGEQCLLVELDIVCDECGVTSGVIFGHHLRTLHAALGRVIERHPELCGTAAEVSETSEFHGVCDPEKVRYN